MQNKPGIKPEEKSSWGGNEHAVTIQREDKNGIPKLFRKGKNLKGRGKSSLVPLPWSGPGQKA